MLKQTRRLRHVATLMATLLPAQALAAPIVATLYKNPQCGCCEAYAKYLREHGFKVTVVPSHDLHTLNQQAGVPDTLEGCHATFIEGYVIEGHVPVDAIQKLLTQHPKIIGISIPGMPTGLPGMEGPRSQPIVVYEITRDHAPPKVFVTES
jgi:hypothetical protein